MQQAGGSDGQRLASFQSAPAKWLEALLLSDEDTLIEPPKSTFNQHPSFTTTGFFDPCLMLPETDNMFLRQNNSPVEFLSHINNNYDDGFSSYGIPEKGSYNEYLSSFRNDKQLEAAQIEFKAHVILQDSVPFVVRAKRGFATHPRSIAERVRRTRISDRIRKLHELVPNMDHKQTNTADMLEEAVEYVKFLQNEIQDLTEQQNKCTCYS